MSRPIWKGHISFGLVNVPVVLNSAERRTNLSFRMIDSRNSARIRYERVNEETGEEVPWDKIVKGYEYDDGNYVLLSEEELQNASPEMTKTIEIEQFVDLEDIDIRYFERPYMLVPDKKGEKGYVQDKVRNLLMQRPADQRANLDAYICGLNDMVSANRDMLKNEFGWDKKQIIFERYD